MRETSPDLTIRQATLDEIIELRWRVLRPGHPRETAQFEGDDDPTTKHFGCFIGASNVGCVTIKRSVWQNQEAWQLRGMAVDDAMQNRGLGRAMLQLIEQTIREDARLPQLIWCNAREAAAGFYERNGWRIASERFDIATVGPHFRMVREVADD